MKKLHSRIRQIWQADHTHSFLNPLILLLGILSLVYRLIIFIRNSFYNRGIFSQEKLLCKVISIGNITVGGMGKTPTVIMLANLLREQGYKPAVLSRGYGGKATSAINIVSDGVHILMGHVEAGDEPVLIAKSLRGIPVLTGANRVITGRVAIEKLGADLLILDDGFQHRRIFRDIDVVLLSRKNPFGNGSLLPRGPLREPPASLKRANLVIWKDSAIDSRFPNDQEQSIGSFLPAFSAYLKPIELRRGDMKSTLPLEYIRGKRICAISGIGSPESFKETIEAIGGVVVGFLAFPDHYRYATSDISEIRMTASRLDAEIITTEKDGIRLTEFLDFLNEIIVLKMEMEVLPSREAFLASIMERLK